MRRSWSTRRRPAACLNGEYGEGTVRVQTKDSYRNMMEMIKIHFHIAGLELVNVPVRGGTDGSRLSWMGLPCPNLRTGGFNFHGPAECITVELMDKATEVLRNIIELYAC